MANKTKREIIVHLPKQRKTVDEISVLLGLKHSTVGFWVKRYDDSQSLENYPRSGRPTPLTKSKFPAVQEKVISVVRCAKRKSKQDRKKPTNATSSEWEFK